ncbi:MAG TPA: hypothetical protein DDY90_07310 [Clostridiales bacterium]|nr:hypothetical protein [Clostridiales bacterium]
MDKKVRKRMLCGMLAAVLFLSGCGRARSGGRGTSRSDTAKAAVKTADALEIRNDGVIRSHLENNRSLNIHRTDRNADTFRLYVENTEAMAGFASGGLTTDYQESIQRVMDVAFGSFAELEIHMLACPDGTDEPEWAEAELNEKMTRRVQNTAFYSEVKMPGSSPLAALAWEPESPFQENALTVLVSSFIEPGNDLNVLAEQIQEYFDKYENSAACLMGITSRFQGDYYVIPYGDQPACRIVDFSGEAPFYMVMVGPEMTVRDFVQNLDQRLEKKNIIPAYGIYTNNVYEQILEEPLNFDVIGDLKSKKAEAGVIRSFNTGTLYEDDGGCAFYAASSGRVETLDSDPNGGISSSTQISIMSKDYNGTAQYGWDYSLYSYDAETGKWVEAGKNALTQSTVTVKNERGPLSDSHSTEPILASGRNEMRISARLNFGSGSPLTRDQVYRVEVRLHLNRENPNAGSESAGTDLRKYTIVHSEYIAAVGRLSSGWGGTKIWTASPRLWADTQKALLCTPILEDLIANLEQMETEYQDNREFVEYIDFVFNVPQEDSAK